MIFKVVSVEIIRVIVFVSKIRFIYHTTNKQGEKLLFKLLLF